jgi:hypothetical protein
MNVPPRIAKISLFAIAAALILVGVTTWANSGHSASQAEIGPPSDRPVLDHDERKEFADSGVAQFADVAG